MANVIRALSSDAAGFEVLPSAARTTTPDTQEFEIQGRGYQYTGLHLIIDVTAVAATPLLTVTVDGVDRISGKTYNLITSAVIGTAVVTALKIAPGITPAANVAVAMNLPPVFRVTVSHGDADSATYSVAGMLV
jgi:hypothetical protein